MMSKEQTLSELTEENRRLRKLLTMEPVIRALAEDLIAKAEMTPKRIPFIVVSQAQFGAYLDYVGQGEAQGSLNRKWADLGYENVTINGTVVLWEWPSDEDKEKAR